MTYAERRMRVLLSCAAWWRGLTPDTPGHVLATAVREFADQHPAVVQNIERALLDDGDMDTVFLNTIDKLTTENTGRVH